MKKVYITLFALIAVLVPAYAHACEWFCSCNCGDNVVAIERRVPTPSPQAQIMEAATPVAPKHVPRLELTADQEERINKPSLGAKKKLPTIYEKRSASLPISQSFKQRNNPNKILLNALQTKKQATAFALLQQQLSPEILDYKNSKGYTPLLYAIKHGYWDIVALLVEKKATLPTLDKVTQIATHDGLVIYAKILCQTCISPLSLNLSQMGMNL